MRRLIFGVVLQLIFCAGNAMAVEEPVYQVSLAQGAFEVRDYPAVVAAQVTLGGDRDQAGNAGFRVLAGYIFGGNTRKQSIAMTAPVVEAPAAAESMAMTAPVTQTRDASGWIVRFIMPRQYTLDALPTPNDPRVHLIAIPPTRVAVVRFSGLARVPDVEARTRELESFIAAHQLRATGGASLARYNPPWTPWFMRRNEVMIAVADIGK